MTPQVGKHYLVKFYANDVFTAECIALTDSYSAVFKFKDKWLKGDTRLVEFRDVCSESKPISLTTRAASYLLWILPVIAIIMWLVIMWLTGMGLAWLTVHAIK